ncbi:37S ribosomal protein S9, mitochondrial [Malassezia vespertilionis]|uniref:Small ribosomal subunit protein uS9m n=1 Tax=Malassezia vespertilionis TaxID=2020962 RepID=A0A2N1JDT0_9BASI|nr:37S ribosomal protein S9, mitochondrial [Malassezia vespertilionis]PKI84682.1 Mrps9p [Malassezia vespertilionis]WFD06059.1 37S ribosomal protein S9, mitochondrial [Malassezia vespertilionis]
MLWAALRTSQARAVPGASIRMMHMTPVRSAQPGPARPPPPERLKPASPAYFTTKPSLVDTLQMLDQLTREVKRELELSFILSPNSKPPPLPQGPTNIWITRDTLHSKLGIALRASQYRSVISRLTLLLRYRALVLEYFAGVDGAFAERSTTRQKELAQQVEQVLRSFMSQHGKTQDRSVENAQTTRSATRGYVDEQGRAYARGRRKESSARIWLVRAKDGCVGEVLVNNVPMSQYFSRTDHREQVVWPLKLAGMLGQYNIFTIVRGGGHTGQAGAIAHGLANALVAMLGTVPGEHANATHAHVKHVLSKDGILNRDPRMVERKKPGLAKARKAFTWVKR